jgi:hypothetical protein
MVRAFCLFGLAILFLLISPPLREQVFAAFNKSVSMFIFYAPYSYVGGIIFVIVAFLISLNRGRRAP